MVPSFDKFLFPILKFSENGEEYSLKELIEKAAKKFSLSEAEILEKVAGNSETKVHSRTQWATTYLVKAGLLRRPKRGVILITDEGKRLLGTGITEITPKFLTDNYPSFAEFSKRKSKDHLEEKATEGQSETPSEIMSKAFEEINTTLASELLELIKSQPPIFFEKLVVKLLLSMGYGGSLDAGIVTSQSHDDGIDGIIKEDKLGLDNIYIQAKRYTIGSVQKPDIQKFIGALTEKRASKGVFITTATFSSGAKETIEKTSAVKIVLIDGNMLTKLMIENNIGVSTKQTYEIKRIDTDFFDEE